MVVGVGVGGDFEKAAIMAKQALTRNVEEHSAIPYVCDLEKEMLEKINKLGMARLVEGQQLLQLISILTRRILQDFR